MDKLCLLVETFRRAALSLTTVLTLAPSTDPYEAQRLDPTARNELSPVSGFEEYCHMSCVSTGEGHGGR